VCADVVISSDMSIDAKIKKTESSAPGRQRHRDATRRCRAHVTAPRIRAEAHHRLASHRTADIVADELRRQIVDGELADGLVLPAQRELADRLGVSLVAVGEALRILESETLVEVRRGKLGGAIVHAPARDRAAYMIGMMLQSDSVPVTDLRVALEALEPSCATFAALRPDRATTVLPELVRLNDAMGEALDDAPQFAEIGRQFHHEIARGCGNKTLIAVLDSLEALWISQEREYLDQIEAEDSYPTMAKRRATLNAHLKITGAIAAGDADAARRLTSRHVGGVHADSLSTHESQQRIRAIPPQGHAPIR
jgi:GntR family transcriptional regulator, transcriptional repressor for pyruvate dehydrogenase complex